MAIQSIEIQNIPSTLITVPASTRYAILTVLVCNYSDPTAPGAGSEGTVFDMHFVKQGEPRGNANTVVRSAPMAAGETFTFDSEKLVLDEGDSIILVSDNPANLSATVSFLEV